MARGRRPAPKLFHQTELGSMYLGNSRDVLAKLEPKSVDLIMTSPPFGLIRQKDYGNVAQVNAHIHGKWRRADLLYSGGSSRLAETPVVWQRIEHVRHVAHIRPNDGMSNDLLGVLSVITLSPRRTTKPKSR